MKDYDNMANQTDSCLQAIWVCVQLINYLKNIDVKSFI